MRSGECFDTRACGKLRVSHDPHPMKYFVRVYCHRSFETGSCLCIPPHPYLLEGSFSSIRAANDRGDKAIGVNRDDDVEWEVIDEEGEVIC
jgi:hypothetical protein